MKVFYHSEWMDADEFIETIQRENASLYYYERFMDVDTVNKVNHETQDNWTDLDWLTRYLEIAPFDLVIEGNPDDVYYD